MARTVELLYKNGILMDRWQSKNGEPRQYGCGEIPENGYIVVRVEGFLKDIPAELLECGGGFCRFLLDESKMSVDEVQLFKDKDRFQWKAHVIKHTITYQRLVKLCTDNTVAWEAKKAEDLMHAKEADAAAKAE